MSEACNYKFVTKEDLTYLVFTPWAQDTNIVHGFSTRFGGVSEGFLESLNLGFNRGDVRERVEENYKRMAKVLDVPYESMVLSKQVHELEITKVSKEDKGNGLIYPNKWESMDGIYTNEPGVTLVTHYADCVPLFFYAPEYGMIGMAHAGWRGTVGEIGRKMVEIWTQQEHIPVEKIQVAIGPSIGPCCFEVDVEVKNAFTNKFGEDVEWITFNEKSQKYHIDLWTCNAKSLQAAGILEEHIIVSKLCTCCYPKLFFSHRHTGGQRGTLGAFMSLKS